LRKLHESVQGSSQVDSLSEEEVGVLKSRAETLDSFGESTQPSDFFEALLATHEDLFKLLKKPLEREQSRVNEGVEQTLISVTSAITKLQFVVQSSSMVEAMSKVELEKLQKKINQIEGDLEAKDKELLAYETEMLALTNQVEAHQKLGENLKNAVA